MKRRPFLKLSSAVTAGSTLLPVPNLFGEEAPTNWAGNITYGTSKLSVPRSVEEVQAQVRKLPRLKALGTRHCFNRIADSRDHLLSTRDLNKVLSLDSVAGTVTVAGGIKYGELAPYLHERGFALPNLASLPHISVAGSIATGTHGSGVQNGNLATPVVALELVDAAGTVHQLRKEKEAGTFEGAVVGLGALGIVTNVTLALQPAYQMWQYVFEQLPMAQLQQHFEAIVAAGYSVSLFTDWRTDRINEVWIKCKDSESTPLAAANEFYGARAATRHLHPIAELSAENCTEQLGQPGPWYERLPHFKMGFTPSSGVELQSEYFVPRQRAMEAIGAVARLGAQISPHLLITELRTIAADTLWMSPCYRQDSLAIHFTWKQDWPAVQKLLPLIERELAPFGARPHWGKLFTMAPEVLAGRYERLPDFRQLVRQFDPEGKFRNDFLKSTIL
jgi:alditol oxidase